MFLWWLSGPVSIVSAQLREREQKIKLAIKLQFPFGTEVKADKAQSLNGYYRLKPVSNMLFVMLCNILQCSIVSIILIDLSLICVLFVFSSINILSLLYTACIAQICHTTLGIIFFHFVQRASLKNTRYTWQVNVFNLLLASIIAKS